MPFFAILLGSTVFPETMPDKALFEGDWSVDLRLESDDPVYRQPMRLEIGEGGMVRGTFYGTRSWPGASGMGRGAIVWRSGPATAPQDMPARPAS